ncbi:MAG TPA: RodZ domain-containing protein [Terriglobales bacterium]|nr:RodZ domain-containing protein [Terriglobales bacterium]
MESFGARLKRERQQRKIELDDISASTKISSRFLRALEEEQFDQLPGGIFNKGFVRAYARHLGIDEEQAIADYLAAVTPSQPEAPTVAMPQPPPKIEPPADRPRAEIPWGWLALALVMIAFGLAMWAFYSQEKSTKEASRSSALVQARKAEPVAPSTAARSTPAPSIQPANTQPSQPAAQEPAAVGSASGPNATPSNTLGASGRFSLLIKVREDSWLFIDADGKPVMHDLLVAPAEKSVEAEKEIVLRAGNMGALELSFNGKKLPSQGDYGEVKTLTFGADGLQPPPPKPAATAPVPQ